MRKSLSLLVVIVALNAIIGCQPEGPAQRAGERTDDAIDSIKHGENPLREKGPLEKAGEKVDDAVSSSSRGL